MNVGKLGLLVAFVFAAGPAAAADPPEPTEDQVIASAMLCYATEAHAEALGGIADERDAAKYAGGIDNEKLYALQQKAQTTEQQIALARRMLTIANRMSLACDDEALSYLELCFRNGGDPNGEDCTGPTWQRAMERVANSAGRRER
jgi:hypothetical protein